MPRARPDAHVPAAPRNLCVNAIPDIINQIVVHAPSVNLNIIALGMGCDTRVRYPKIMYFLLILVQRL